MRSSSHPFSLTSGRRSLSQGPHECGRQTANRILHYRPAAQISDPRAMAGLGSGLLAVILRVQGHHSDQAFTASSSQPKPYHLFPDCAGGFLSCGRMGRNFRVWQSQGQVSMLPFTSGRTLDKLPGPSSLICSLCKMEMPVLAPHRAE